MQADQFNESLIESIISVLKTEYSLLK